VVKAPARDPGDLGMASSVEAELLRPEKAKSFGTPERIQHMKTFPSFEIGLPSSQAPLLGPGPLRTGRETFVLIRLRPFKRLFQGDAAPVRTDVGCEPCRGTLDGAGRGYLHSPDHLSHEGRDSANASP
jgi:hypothetical protein